MYTTDMLVAINYKNSLQIERSISVELLVVYWFLYRTSPQQNTLWFYIVILLADEGSVLSLLNSVVSYYRLYKSDKVGHSRIEHSILFREFSLFIVTTILVSTNRFLLTGIYLSFFYLLDNTLLYNTCLIVHLMSMKICQLLI